MMTLNRVVLFSNEIHSEASGYVMSCWWSQVEHFLEPPAGSPG